MLSSPSGKLVQIEHALTAVGSGQTSLGIKAANGVVIATEKKLPSILVDEASVKKIQSLTPNIGVVYSGMGPDFRVLVRKSRKQAEQYHRLYKEPIPVTQLVRETAAVMQEFTQSGGVRPFGVSLLVAGFDDSGPQLYQVDPSGSYFSWKASAMGKNVSNAKTFLEKRYTDDMELDDAVHTAILTLKEGFEGQISGKNIEIGIIGTDKKFRQAPSLLPTLAINALLIISGSLRGRGWKYGSGFVDGVFPVMSPTGQQILDFVQKEVDKSSIWEILDTLPASHTIWDDIINVAVQLRLNKQWGSIILICEWILYKSSFKPDVICYNLLLDAYGQKSQHKAAESTYLELLEARCIPTEDTYALLLKAYCKSGLLDKAEAVFGEMRKEGLCEKAEEIFEQMQKAGHEPDVYSYNALMEAYSRAGFPYGAAEIFSLMQHMGCEPDRASYNIMVDAYGRAGLHEDAEVAFEEMKRLGITPTVKSHMLLLSAYSKAGNVAKCEDIVNQMRKSGLELDTFVINSMLNLYGRLGQLEKMEEVLTAMEKGPYAADISTYNILINIYGRAGFFEKMEELFQSLPTKNLKPDVVTWTSRLGAYSRKKLYKRCLEIFEEMIDAGCYPDGGTAKVLLGACSSEDQTEQELNGRLALCP
ncbi:unnamed protein product [Prunus armeniaca]|uniref:PROP1-like PPR domain-containing protein n=1 Tax=Prunus armeniaca TaxID=36596 RepID=A0A6J5UJV0_PRUAR|nr:unnamed protein product [Prunus armeniaca]